jgi:hypothetical protein
MAPWSSAPYRFQALAVNRLADYPIFWIGGVVPNALELRGARIFLGALHLGEATPAKRAATLIRQPTTRRLKKKPRQGDGALPCAGTDYARQTRVGQTLASIGGKRKVILWWMAAFFRLHCCFSVTPMPTGNPYSRDSKNRGTDPCVSL